MNSILPSQTFGFVSKSLITLAIFLCLHPMAFAKDMPLTVFGKGEYTWWGIKVYDATLYAPDAFNGNFKETRPIALEIQYDMDIKKSFIIDSTQEQWEEISIGQSQRCEQKDVWLNQLDSIWLNLKKGDTLKVLVGEDNISHFKHNGEPIGQLQDPEFSDCFLAIWLAEDTTAPDLREKLLKVSRNDSLDHAFGDFFSMQGDE